MSDSAPADTLIIGVGSRQRRDDGAGPVAVDRLNSALARLVASGQVEICEEWGEGSRLIDLMQGRGAVYLIDAASTVAQPGTVHLFDAAQKTIPSDMLCYSTHRFGVAEAVEVARNLGLMPPRLWLYAIEGADFGHGEGLSEGVERAVTEVCQLIALEIGPGAG